jgi:uncharacterized membrane protein YfcA
MVDKVMPALAPWQWILGALCAALVGVAKTGVPGVGILAVPLMVLAVGDARASAGWLLPILCVADVLAIVYYRRHAQARRLFGLAPWVLAGMAAGYQALALPEPVLRRVVAAIVLAMVGAHLWRRGAGASKEIPGGWLHSARYGVLAGFATTVANAAGPVMNVYLLSKRLPKEEFVAAGAWFFFVINLTKTPLYAARGMIGAGSLLFDACMLPAVGLGALVGRAILRRLPQRAFEAAVFALTAAATLLLFR